MVFQLPYRFDALEFEVWQADGYVDLVILAVCISLNAGECFVQSGACDDLFFVFSSYFADFCVPLFVDLLSLHLKSSITTMFFLERLWIILNPVDQVRQKTSKDCLLDSVRL